MVGSDEPGPSDDDNLHDEPRRRVSVRRGEPPHAGRQDGAPGCDVVRVSPGECGTPGVGVTSEVVGGRGCASVGLHGGTGRWRVGVVRRSRTREAWAEEAAGARSERTGEVGQDVLFEFGDGDPNCSSDLPGRVGGPGVGCGASSRRSCSVWRSCCSGSQVTVPSASGTSDRTAAGCSAARDGGGVRGRARVRRQLRRTVSQWLTAAWRGMWRPGRGGRSGVRCWRYSRRSGAAPRRAA